MTSRPPVRVGVVGVGYLGALHVEKYRAASGCRLAGVHDVDRARAREVAEANGTEAFGDLAGLLAAVDAVSVVVPTADHAEVALAAAAAGVHVLIEKPLAADAESGARLVEALRRAGIVAQVGHLERFNPVLREMRAIVDAPRFIECHRLSPFAGRGTDTDVVYDVMIHDLDLISFFVGRDVESVEAVGVPVLSPNVDIANARIRFEGGAIANVTASRASLKRERKLRVFQRDTYVSMDFDARTAMVARLRPESRGRTFATAEEALGSIDFRNLEFAGADPLGDEIAAFVEAVAAGTAPAVGLDVGLEALRIADRVLAAMDVPDDS